MRTELRLFVALTVLALSSVPAPGQEAAKAEEKKARLTPYYVYLANEAGLDEEQRQKLIPIVARRVAREKAWKEQEWPKLYAATASWHQALQYKDDAMAEEAKTQCAGILAKRLQIDVDFATGLRGTLREDQLVPWETAKLMHRVNSFLGSKKVKLTMEQKEKLTGLCADMAKSIWELDLADKKSRDKLWGELTRAVAEDLLTPEQQAQMKAEPQPRAQSKKKSG